MARHSWPWAGHNIGDANPDAPYTNKYFADMFQLLNVYDRTTMGVVDTGHASFPGGLIVNAGAGLVTVQTGVGVCDGMWVTYDAPFNLTPDDTPSNRTDLVVIRKTITVAPLQEVNVVLKKGTDGSGTPPALTQDLTMWEVPLAEVPVTPGPTIGAVVNVAVVVRSPLAPGYQYNTPTNGDAVFVAAAWNDIDGGVILSLGPGKWAVRGTLVCKANTLDQRRRGRIYNQTLAAVVSLGSQLGMGSLAEDFSIPIPDAIVIAGVVTELRLQFEAAHVNDSVYGDDNADGPSTSIYAERVI